MAERLIGYDKEGRLDIPKDREGFRPHPLYKGMLYARTTDGKTIVTEAPDDFEVRNQRAIVNFDQKTFSR